MPQAPPGIVIDEERKTEPFVVFFGGRQAKLGRRVLLVTLAPGVLSSSPGAQRLDREAKVLSELDHPNIVRLYDYVQTEAHNWLVLEDVVGTNLAELVQRGMSWRAVAAIGLEVSRALNHAHQLGHHHGSITTQVVDVANTGRIKISGFGRNVVQDSDSTEVLNTEVRGGLSPETSIGHAQTALADLFALGALLFEAASGRPPFGDIRAIDYPAKVRNEAHPSLMTIAPQLPRALSALIEQLLEKLPARRPPHAAHVAERLEALIGSSTLPILRAELERLGLVARHQEERADASPTPEPAPAPRHNWRPFLLPLVGISASAVLGAALLFSSFAPTPSRERGSSSVVAPNQALHLRVVASPWAHVFVDGVQRETTPFAHPIVLTAGSHVVRLEHPNAPAEERTISGQPGQVVLLNVQMHVKVELPPPVPVGQGPEATP